MKRTRGVRWQSRFTTKCTSGPVFYSTVVSYKSKAPVSTSNLKVTREPSNPADIHALQVVHGESCIGYIHREHASFLSPAIEDGIGLMVVDWLAETREIGLRIRGDVKSERLLQCASRNACRDEEYRDRFVKSLLEVLEGGLGVGESIWNASELECVDSLIRMTNDCKRLLCRLLSRKRGWLRIESILGNRYTEIEDDQRALNDLVALGLCRGVDYGTMEELAEILNACKKDELSVLNVHVGGKKSWSKPALLKALETSKTLFGQYVWDTKGFRGKLNSTVSLVCLDSNLLETLERFHRVYLLELFDPIEMPVKPNYTGSFRYMSYDITRTRTLFPSREAYLKLESISALYTQVRELFESKQYELVLEHGKQARGLLESPKESGIFHRYSVEAVVYRICHVLTKAMQKLKLYNDAVELLSLLLEYGISNSRRGDWWNRLALIHETHLKDSEKAFQVCEAALLEQHSQGDLVAILHRTRRLSKRLGGDIMIKSPRDYPETVLDDAPSNCVVGQKSKFWSEDNTVCSVEDLALEFYSREWKYGVHCEGTLIRALVSLLMWDVIWAPVPDVFQSPYQDSPIDMRMTGSLFYDARADLIDARVKEIASLSVKGLHTEVSTSWNMHRGTACIGINWAGIDSCDTMTTLVGSIGGKLMSKLCAHLFSNYSEWSSGMPDLLLWDGARVKFVEVKGPNDRLSSTQTAWLDRLIDMGAEVEICKIKS